MERLTERTENGTPRPKRKCSDCIQLEDRNLTDCTHECEYDVISRLAEYEDTNLTPEQIKEIDKQYLEKCQEINDLKQRLDAKETINQLYKTTTSMLSSDKDCLVKKLRHYNELNEQGRLIELPCKFGDILYCTRMGEIKEYKVFAINIGLRENTKSCVILTKTTRGSTVDFELIDFGKIAFLTYEDAEKALAEREVSE